MANGANAVETAKRTKGAEHALTRFAHKTSEPCLNFIISRWTSKEDRSKRVSGIMAPKIAAENATAVISASSSTVPAKKIGKGKTKKSLVKSSASVNASGGADKEHLCTKSRSTRTQASRPKP